MIGPIFRSPRRPPHSHPFAPGFRRRAKNIVVDALEYLVARFGHWERQRLVIQEAEIEIAGLPPAFDGYRITLVTDLHYSPIVPRWWIESAVRIANGMGGDLIALGGDYVDDDIRFVEGLGELLGPLRAPDGVVAVLGNHDHYVDAPGVRRQLRAAGIHELFNSWISIERGTSRLTVGGVGDLEMDAIDFERVFEGADPSVPRIVISHDPDVFAYWPDEIRLDLMLSGHTHGGQAFLPVVGPPYIPSQFGSRYLSGRFAEGSRQLYVSRGVGASGLPIRWKCPPELNLVTLRRRNS